MRKKMEKFDKLLTEKRLDKAFGKISDVCYEACGFYAEDAISDAVDDLEKPVCRVRYEQDDTGERYIFEIRRHDEDEYGFECSYELKDNLISYEALTQIREHMKHGYDIVFK